MKDIKKYIPAYILLLVLTIIISSKFSYRLGYDNGEVKKALHFNFPGYVTIYHPADTIILSESSFTLSDTTINKEIGSFMVLQAIGWCDSTYYTVEVDNHYIAVSPDSERQEWSWSRKYYRIGRWKDWKDK